VSSDESGLRSAAGPDRAPAALKRRVLEAVSSASDRIVELAERVYDTPELGFKEVRTAKLFADQLAALGLSPTTGVACTGVVAEAHGRSGRATVALMAELDALRCPGHPRADPRSGAAHACGHHAQVAAVLGAVAALIESGVMSELDGSLKVMGVPAEEYVEIEYRRGLRREGRIRFFGGKQEFLRLGMLAGVDAALMFHVHTTAGGKKATIGGTTNGFVGKLVLYEGREAHAGAEPHLGVNALSAATLGIMGVNALRETFRDEDHVRVHPIITRGGDLVNIVPADVRLETYVRAASTDAIVSASAAVDRAFRAGADALGAEVTIENLPGYLPRRDAPELDALVAGNVAALLGEDAVEEGGHGCGSTDLGDVSHVLPAAHPMIGGASGRSHSSDFRITDPHLAYVVPAAVLATTVVDLLHHGAWQARRIRSSFKPSFGVDEYMETWDHILLGRKDLGRGDEK